MIHSEDNFHTYDACISFLHKLKMTISNAIGSVDIAELPGRVTEFLWRLERCDTADCLSFSTAVVLEKSPP